jgi:hypothetical protein
MLTSKINTYFKKKNINVIFNTLGCTEKLVNLYCKEMKQYLGNIDIISNTVKHYCYSKYYNFEPRPKLTGFENLKTLDLKTRTQLKKHVSGLTGTPSVDLSSIEPVEGSYLEELKNVLDRIKNPLLYLSGGLDSEFVAKTMVNANVKFTPVIFRWLNDDNQIINIDDILYAIDFCNNHKLTPIIRDINVEKLWTNPEFELLAKETNIESPQLNTYVYITELMAEEFPEATHLFGGEIRFRNITYADKQQTLMLMAKEPTANLDYNGQTYNITYVSSLNDSADVGIYLSYYLSGNYTSNQPWNIGAWTDNASGTWNYTTGGTQTGDNWYMGILGSTGGIGFEFSTNGGTSWTTFGPTGPVTGTIYKFTVSRNSTSKVVDSGTINILVRNKSTPQTTISSSIRFIIDYVYYVPSQNIYSTPGTYTSTVPRGAGVLTGFSANFIGVGGGGAGGRVPLATTSGKYSKGGGSGGKQQGWVPTVTFSNWGSVYEIKVGSGGVNAEVGGTVVNAATRSSVQVGLSTLFFNAGENAGTSANGANFTYGPFGGTGTTGGGGGGSSGGDSGGGTAGSDATTDQGGNGAPGTAQSLNPSPFLSFAYAGAGGGGGGYAAGGTGGLGGGNGGTNLSGLTPESDGETALVLAFIGGQWQYGGGGGGGGTVYYTPGEVNKADGGTGANGYVAVYI